MNSTTGLEFKDWLSSHWKVAACRVLQHGCPGGAPAVGLPRGHGEPGAGEAAPAVRSQVGFSGSQSIPDCKFPDLHKMSRLFFSFLGKFGVFEPATCGGWVGWGGGSQTGESPTGPPDCYPCSGGLQQTSFKTDQFYVPFCGERCTKWEAVLPGPEEVYSVGRAKQDSGACPGVGVIREAGLGIRGSR